MKTFIIKTDQYIYRQGANIEVIIKKEYSINNDKLYLYCVNQNKIVLENNCLKKNVISTSKIKPGLYYFILKFHISLKEERSDIFRILMNDDLIVYNINHYLIKGINVFALDGGMSAEYSVEKTLETFTGGVSHSWFTLSEGLGNGPRPVYATPQFLELSIEKTIYYYDTYLGKDQTFDTILLSSGAMPVSYFSTVFKAPILPLQYLVSANSIREIELMAIYSKHKGIESYFTYSYDESMKEIGVAWCELLNLPLSYLKFIIQHKVKNIIFVGSIGVEDGETTAKKVISGSEKNDENIKNGDIYIMYPGVEKWVNNNIISGLENTNKLLSEHIADFNNLNLSDNFIRIGDWESGIENIQIKRVEKKIKTLSLDIKTYYIFEDNALKLYDVATDFMSKFLIKNRELLIKNEQIINGIVMNPYLISHPLYEAYNQLIPCLYWQFMDLNYLIEHKILNIIYNIYLLSNSKLEFKSMSFYINATKNFGGFGAQKIYKELKNRNFLNIYFNDIKNGNFAEECFKDQSIEPPCKKILKEVIQLSKSNKSLQEWYKNTLALLPEDTLNTNEYD